MSTTTRSGGNAPGLPGGLPYLAPLPLPDLAAAARTRHLRRQLAQATEHGIALLATLGLPRLVTSDFDPLDPAAIGDAVDRAIAALDEADAPDEDLEDEGEAEPSLGWIERMGQGFLASGGTADLEPALGWTNAVRQLDLGQGTEDGEHTLGAPEHHPFAFTMTAAHFEPADGRGVRRYPRDGSQVAWARGARQDGEGETEPGYDLPEGDDERCASEHDGCEPSLGSSDHLDQERWADGNASGSDCELDPLDDVGRCPGAGPHVSRGDLFRLEQRAKDLRRRLRSGRTPAPSGGNLVPVDLRVIGVRGLSWMGGARG